MQSTNHQRKHIDCLTDYQLVQLIAGPSRVCALSSTLIDHVVCSSSFAVTRVLQAIGVSDHRVPIVELDVSVLLQAPEVRNVRAFRKCNWDDVKSCLSNAPWSAMEVYDDVNDMWEYFYGILHGCLNSYIPLKEVRYKYSKRPTPWLNPTFLHSIKEKYTGQNTWLIVHRTLSIYLSVR